MRASLPIGSPIKASVSSAPTPAISPRRNFAYDFRAPRSVAWGFFTHQENCGSYPFRKSNQRPNARWSRSNSLAARYATTALVLSLFTNRRVFFRSARAVLRASATALPSGSTMSFCCSISLAKWDPKPKSESIWLRRFAAKLSAALSFFRRFANKMASTLESWSRVAKSMALAVLIHWSRNLTRRWWARFDRGMSHRRSKSALSAT